MATWWSGRSWISWGALGALLFLSLAGCSTSASQASAVPLSEEAARATGAEALRGRTWVLREIDSQPAPVDPPITAVFTEDSVSGSGGCNNYSANVTYSDGGTFQIGPVSSTKKGCPSPILPAELRYLQALGSAFRFTFERKKLVLSWAPGGQQAPGRLVFEASGPSAPPL